LRIAYEALRIDYRLAGTEVFSNIHGLTHIEFPKTGFKSAQKAKQDLRLALERERLLLPRAAVKIP